MKPLLFICAAALGAMLVAGCGGRNAGDADAQPSEPTEELPARFKVQKVVQKPDLGDAAKALAFQQAIKEAASLFGAQPQPLHSDAEGDEVPGGVSFDVPSKKIEKMLHQTHTNFLARGFYLFRYHQSFGIGDGVDKVGLVPTADKYAVMALMDTNGDNYEISTAGVIAWMRELEQEQPFVLTGIGFDYMEGFFTTPIKNPSGLAKRMYQFCPDIVDQGTGTVEKLASELKKGALYFWWD